MEPSRQLEMQMLVRQNRVQFSDAIIQRVKDERSKRELASMRARRDAQREQEQLSLEFA